MCDIDCNTSQDIIPMPRIVSVQTDKNCYACDYVIVATGGLSKTIIKHCKNNIVLDDDLVLKGLNILYNKNTK